MSDWEIVQENKTPQMPESNSDWEMIQTPVSQQKPNESFTQSLMKAVPRVREDVVRGVGEFVKKIPYYAQQATTEIPGAFNILTKHPYEGQRQALAGLAELGQNVFNKPHDLVNYLSRRLNLIPEDVNKLVQMGRMPANTQQMINNQFGEANNPGDALIRGAYRNILTEFGLGGLAKTINPMRLNAKSIANDVLREERSQNISHNKKYNKIWNEAEKSGFNNVPVDHSKLKENLDVISKYKTPREYESLEAFIKNPTLQNAQKAQSDMNQIHRNLGEKSRTTSLTSEEKSVYNSAKNAESNIQQNMFKNEKGVINKHLQNKYRDVTSSYRENVIPYKYNKYIQGYKAREMLAPELINALSRGEFAAKKGHLHPEMKYRKIILPAITGAGLLGGGLSLYDHLIGNTRPTEPQGNY